MFDQETPDPSRSDSSLSESKAAIPKPDPSPLKVKERPESVGPFSIVDTLGSGAMGEVYLARDKRLDRWVALKRVQPEHHGAETVARFRREAKAVAKLHHRSIVQVHDLLETEESDWLVMERLEGELLAERLEEGTMAPLDAIHVAKRIAEGLGAAHAAGVVHRDLKASNIMLTSHGVKILDFGLAKSLPDRRQDETAVTSEGQLIGTIVAMAPEQAMGLKVDERADLFALGMLIYEMLTGAPPFKRRSALATMNAICDAPAERLDDQVTGLPPALVSLVHQLLAKSPEERPADAQKVIDRLRQARAELGVSSSSHATGTLPALPVSPVRRRLWRLAWVFGAFLIPLLALRLFHTPPSQAEAPGPLKLIVAPFHYSGLENHRFFAQGLSEEIRSRLITLDSVLVISRLEDEAGLKLDGGPIDAEVVPEADSPAAHFVLNGTVAWPGDGHRITVALRLTRLIDGEVVWAQQFRENSADLLTLQSRLAGDVATQLPVEIDAAEREAIQLQGTFSQAAYLAYLEGLDWERRSRFASVSINNAVEAYRRAVEEDPLFVDAHARWIRAETLDFLNRARSPEKALEITRHLATLVDLAPGQPATLLASAEVAYRVEGRHEIATAQLRSVLEKEPHNQEALATLGFVLRRQGRFDEAIEALEKAFLLSSLDASLPAFIAETYRAQRRFERALHWYRISLEMVPGDGWIRGQAALTLFELRGCSESACDESEAVAWLEDAPNPQDESIRLHRFWLAALVAGDEGEALEDALEWLPPAGRFEEKALDLISLPSRVAILRRLGRLEERRLLLSRHRSDLENDILLDSDYPTNHSFLAIVLALEATDGPGGRDSDEAFGIARWHGREGIRLAEGDKFSGPRARERWAMALALSGRESEALEVLEPLLGASYQRAITHQALRLDPVWMSLKEKIEAGA